MSNVIETRDLTMVYRSGLWARKVTALTSLSLEVTAGEIFGYLGANGAGKTTTIKILVGLMRPTAGRALVLGQDCASVPVKRRIGYMPEDPYFYEYLTGAESLDFYARLFDMPRAARRKKADELLELVRLSDARRTRVRAYSKGMRQRLGLAQALINDPEMVILDEPLSGLDPMGRMELRNVILGLRDEGRTVFFSSHILADVEMICDRVGILVKGDLSAVGTIDRLLASRVKAVEIVAERVSEEGVRRLGAIAERVLHEGDRIAVRVADYDAADAAVRVVTEHGGRLRAMTPQKDTLEEYFVRSSRA